MLGEMRYKTVLGKNKKGIQNDVKDEGGLGGIC